MEQRLSLVTLGVTDLEQSLRFYEALGWKRGNDNPSVVFFQLPGMILALWSRTALAEDAGLAPNERGFGGITLAYNARSKAEVGRGARRGGARGGPRPEVRQGDLLGRLLGLLRRSRRPPLGGGVEPEWTDHEEGRDQARQGMM